MASKSDHFRLGATSSISEDRLSTFLASPLKEDLTEVPGIGDKGAALLAESGVCTAVQLLGVFLTLKRPGISVQEHCDAFLRFLKEKGINSHRSGIVLAIAEKANTFVPGIFNADEVAMD